MASEGRSTYLGSRDMYRGLSSLHLVYVLNLVDRAIHHLILLYVERMASTEVSLITSEVNSTYGKTSTFKVFFLRGGNETGS